MVPVVARKKGMDEFYTSADGRQKKRPPSMIPEPVRGESSQPGKQMLILFPLGHVLSHQKLHIRRRELLATTTQSIAHSWKMRQFR